MSVLLFLGCCVGLLCWFEGFVCSCLGCSNVLLVFAWQMDVCLGDALSDLGRAMGNCQFLSGAQA